MHVSAPGASGVFGQAVGAFDLVHQIGLQNDSNHSLTRRMLLLEESVSLLAPAVHQKVVEAALRRYIDVGSTRPDKAPRVLLNDVTRYWHTITVDYQAKAVQGPDESGLRYLKLVIPRKILFAGTAMSLLLCGRHGWHDATADDLAQQFAMPPLDRLLQVWSSAPELQGALKGVVEVVERFLQRSADRDWRAEVKRASKSAPNAAFTEMSNRADDLQRHLETIFFEWHVVADRSRTMLAF